MNNITLFHMFIMNSHDLCVFRALDVWRSVAGSFVGSSVF